MYNWGQTFVLSQSHFTTVSWCWAHLGLMTRCLLTVLQLRSCSSGVPSLTIGQVCLLSVIVSNLCQYVQGFYDSTCFTWSCIIHYIQGLCQSRLGTADYALLIVAEATRVLLDTWKVVHMTAAKFKPLIRTMSGLALCNVANILIIMILNYLCLLPA
jgi:hypothetical protein